MKKILIIEDEAALKDEIGDILKHEGFNVLTAENGKFGLLMAQKHNPDLILCDIMMPVMSGIEVLSSLRADKETRMIQFVFMTALADRKDLRTGMELGADDYLTKPFTRGELLKTISTRLEKNEAIDNKLEEDLDQLRKSVISYIPHELRSPLNGIIGLGSYLKDSEEDLGLQEINEIGRIIYESGNNLLSTISKYLIYISLEAKPESFSLLNEVTGTSDIITSLGNETANNYNRINDLVCQNEEITISASVDSFSIIVKELIENAFKFSDPGKPVTVTFVKKNGQAELSVHNTGRAFPEGSIHKIGAFNQFERNKYEQQGSGLGLIITKKIVALINGRLSIESNITDGTTITVYFSAK